LTHSPYICTMLLLSSEMSPRERQLQTVKLANRVLNGSRSLTLINEMFLYFTMGEIDPNSENPLQIKTTKKRYAEYRGIAHKDFKRIAGELKKIFKNFNNNPLIIEDEETGRLLQRNWLTGLDLDGDNMYISVSPEVGGFLMYKKGQLYTKVLYDISKFKSVHTIGIKEIIEAELFKKQAHFDKPLSYIRFKLGVEKKYTNLQDFKRFVLDIAKKELEEVNFPIQFKYSILNVHGIILKKGQRGGHSVRFYIKDKREKIKALFESPKDYEIIENENQTTIDEIIVSETEAQGDQYKKEYEQLKSWGISDDDIYDVILEYGIDRVQSSIVLVCNSYNVKSPSGLFIKSLKENWQSAKQIEADKKKKQNKRRKEIEQEIEAEQEKKQAKHKAFLEAQKEICDELLASEKSKGLDYYYEVTRKYIAPLMMKFYIKNSPKETYEKSMFTGYLLHTIEQEHPELFKSLYEEYPDFKKEYEVY